MLANVSATVNYCPCVMGVCTTFVINSTVMACQTSRMMTDTVLHMPPRTHISLICSFRRNPNTQCQRQSYSRPQCQTKISTLLLNSGTQSVQDLKSNICGSNLINFRSPLDSPISVHAQVPYTGLGRCTCVRTSWSTQSLLQTGPLPKVAEGHVSFGSSHAHASSGGQGILG